MVDERLLASGKRKEAMQEKVRDECHQVSQGNGDLVVVRKETIEEMETGNIDAKGQESDENEPRQLNPMCCSVVDDAGQHLSSLDTSDPLEAIL
jgi:hypothetical protein